MTRIGIIGAGPNAAGHAKYYAQSTRAKLIGIADIDAARAAALVAETGGTARAVTDYRELLADVDAVVVASPNFLHKEQALAVVAAGKHLYCEKPMGLNLADAREIAAAVAGAKVKSAVGFSVRFDPTIQSMARLAREGKFGRLVSLCSRRLFFMDMSKTAPWRRNPDQSGGLIMEINIHEIDWMMSIGGPVTSVYARTWSRTPEHPRANDQLFITLAFEGGATGMHEGSWISPTPQFFRQVSGTDGGAYTNEWGNTLYYAATGANRAEEKPDPAFDLRGNFLDSIAGTAAPVADTAYALKVMAVAEAVLESAQSGQPVKPAVV